MQVADGVVFELLFATRRPVHHRRQAADAVALKTAVQRRAGKVGNRFLQGVEAVIERQQRMLAKRHDGGFLLYFEHRRGRFGAKSRIRRGGPLTPLGHGRARQAVAGG